MGHAKTQLMEEQERGWRSPGDLYVCAECASEQGLATFVGSVADCPRCDYCGRTNDMVPIATHIDRVLGFIAESLQFEYGDPADELPYESAEGGYQGDVLETDEVLVEEHCDLASGRLHQDVVGAFRGKRWCRRDYFRLRAHEALIAGWQHFCDQVIHRTRFVFLSDALSPDELDAEIPNPEMTLMEIGRAVSQVGLVRTYPAGTRWVRARTCVAGRAANAASLGPPPREKAAANRMSPAGIPMFYGARGSATAIAELMAIPENAGFAFVTVGQFLTSQPMLLIDLTDLPPVPSLFDPAARDTVPHRIHRGP